MRDAKSQDHVDGLGLNDLIKITCDAPDASGAPHLYVLTIQGPDGVDVEVGRLQFQKGPRLDPASTPGLTEAAVMTVLMDRLRGFQEGPFKCRENALTLTKLEEAHLWSGARARERHRRGVLGKNEK